MRILIAGGSGFLGSHLASALAAANHEITILTRQPLSPTPSYPSPSPSPLASPPSRLSPSPYRLIQWSPDGSLGPWAAFTGPIDTVINLSGASIGDGRWTARRKNILLSSRFNATRSLVHFIQKATPTPTLFISSSAIGYYGNGADAELTESAPAGTDFLAQLCAGWEAAARRVASLTTRVVFLRSGLILDAREGALPRMLRPFRLGVGGPFGSGRQYMSWIHRDDWVAMVLWLFDQGTITGPINATAPDPVTNAEFTRALGRALHRPAFMRAPAFALRLALGEMANPLLLFSQRVRPARALAAGFHFTYTSLDRAFANLLAR